MCGSGNAVNKQRLQQHQKEQGSKKVYEELNDIQCSGVRNQFPRLQMGSRGSRAARAVHLAAALKISLVPLLSSFCGNEAGSQESNTANKCPEGTASFLDFFCFAYYPLYIKPYSHSRKPRLWPLLATLTTSISLWRSNVHQCICSGQVRPSSAVIGSKSQRSGHLSWSLCRSSTVHTYLCWFSAFPD